MQDADSNEDIEQLPSGEVGVPAMLAPEENTFSGTNFAHLLNQPVVSVPAWKKSSFAKHNEALIFLPGFNSATEGSCKVSAAWDSHAPSCMRDSMCALRYDPACLPAASRPASGPREFPLVREAVRLQLAVRQPHGLWKCTEQRWVAVFLRESPLSYVS